MPRCPDVVEDRRVVDEDVEALDAGRCGAHALVVGNVEDNRTDRPRRRADATRAPPCGGAGAEQDGEAEVRSWRQTSRPMPRLAPVTSAT